MLDHLFSKTISDSEQPARSGAVRTIALIVIAGFAIAVLYHFLISRFSYGYPFSTFLFRPEDRFNDFKNSLRCVDHSLGGPSWDPLMQSPYWKTGWPFITILYYLFLPFGLKWGTAIFISLFVITISLFLWENLKSLTIKKRIAHTLILSLFTYPVLFAIDRGNAEMIVFAFLAIFFSCFGRNSHFIGLVALACAIAMKAHPAVFLILLACDRKIKDCFFVVFLSIGLNIVAAAALPGGLSHNLSNSLSDTISLYRKSYIIGNEGLMFGNSLWGVGKVALFCVERGSSAISELGSTFTKLQFPYLCFCMAVFSLTCLYVLHFKTSWWKRVTLLTFSMILFPYVSADYRLLHIYFPMLFFINSNFQSNYTKYFMIIFGLLLVPKGYYHLPFCNEATIQVVLNPLIMVIAMFMIIWDDILLKRNKNCLLSDSEMKLERGTLDKL